MLDAVLLGLYVTCLYSQGPHEKHEEAFLCSCRHTLSRVQMQPIENWLLGHGQAGRQAECEHTSTEKVYIAGLICGKCRWSVKWTCGAWTAAWHAHSLEHPLPVEGTGPTVPQAECSIVHAHSPCPSSPVLSRCSGRLFLLSLQHSYPLQKALYPGTLQTARCRHGLCT